MDQLSILCVGNYCIHLGYRKMGFKEMPKVMHSTDDLGSETGNLTFQE